MTGFLLLVTALGALAAGQSGALQGEIRFQAADREIRWVGQQQELHLELWTDGFSFADQWFVIPEVKGAYLLQPDASTLKLSENRDGVPWQGLRYTLLLYPQQGGTLQVPAFDVSFSARAGFGTEPASFRYSTPPLEIKTRRPPGAKLGSLLVTTSSFSMESSWTPRAGPDGTAELKVGDAITLKVTRRAQNVPGMVFSPLPDINIDGLGIYPASPEVNDRVNRGALSGERTDSVTFICEREGRYRVPEIRFQWWDPGREQLAEQKVSPLELVVAANPAWTGAAAGSAATVRDPFDWNRALMLGGALLLVALGWYVGFPWVRKHLQNRRDLIESGEPWAFRKVRQACESGNPIEAYSAITLWLSRVESLRPGATLMEFAEQSGIDELKKEATALQERVASGLTKEWTGLRLAQLLAQSREGMDQPSKASHVLQALNPPLIKEKRGQKKGVRLIFHSAEKLT
jgi:hypothetical protein